VQQKKQKGNFNENRDYIYREKFKRFNFRYFKAKASVVIKLKRNLIHLKLKFLQLHHLCLKSTQ